MPEKQLTLLQVCCSLGLYSEISRLLHRGSLDVLPAQVGQRNAVSSDAVVLRFHTADGLVDGSYGTAMHGDGPPATTTCASSVWPRKLQWMVDGLVGRCQTAPGTAPTARRPSDAFGTITCVDEDSISEHRIATNNAYVVVGSSLVMQAAWLACIALRLRLGAPHS